MSVDNDFFGKTFAIDPRAFYSSIQNPNIREELRSFLLGHKSFKDEYDLDRYFCNLQKAVKDSLKGKYPEAKIQEFVDFVLYQAYSDLLTRIATQLEL